MSGPLVCLHTHVKNPVQVSARHRPYQSFPINEAHERCQGQRRNWGSLCQGSTHEGHTGERALAGNRIGANGLHGPHDIGIRQFRAFGTGMRNRVIDREDTLQASLLIHDR
jgi:hypothetical protein